MHIKQEEGTGMPALAIRIPDLPDLTTLRRFREVVWKQLIPPEHGPDSSIILLDEAAAQFQPVRCDDLAILYKLTSCLSCCVP